MSLKDYIQGNRSGKEANRIERQAMNDPFLQEALDGFDAVEGDHVTVIEKLEKRYTNPATPINRYKKLLWYGSVAASILLLMGVSLYFFSVGTVSKESYTIDMHQPIEKEKIEKLKYDNIEKLNDDIKIKNIKNEDNNMLDQCSDNTM